MKVPKLDAPLRPVTDTSAPASSSPAVGQRDDVGADDTSAGSPLRALRQSDAGVFVAKLSVGLAMIGSSVSSVIRSDRPVTDPKLSRLSTQLANMQGEALGAGRIDFGSAVQIAHAAGGAALDALENPTSTVPVTRDALVALPAFQALSAADQAGVLRVFAHVDAAGGNLYRLLAGRSAVGATRSVEQQSTLGHLIAWSDEVAALPDGRRRTIESEALQNALQDVATPGIVQQGRKGTCTVTSIQFYFAREQPADYVRLLRDLTRAKLDPTSAPVRTLTGATLQLGTEGLDHDASGRRLSERVFQIAGMETGNGDRIYLNEQDGHVHTRPSFIAEETQTFQRQERSLVYQLNREERCAAHAEENGGMRRRDRKAFEARVELLTDSLKNVRARLADTTAMGERFERAPRFIEMGGLLSEDATAFMNALMGTSLTNLDVQRGQVDALLTVLEDREAPLALIGMHWEGEAHMVAFERTWVDAQTGERMVELRNPQGRWDHTDRAPVRTALDGEGRVRLTAAEMMKTIFSVALELDGPVGGTLAD